MIQTISEKLQLKEEKNLLIQGLPSSIEKQFTKISFSKNVTPLLRSRKIDFALIFAVNQNQLKTILQDVLPALHEEGKLWIAFPKTTSKITSDLNRDCSWSCLTAQGYVGVKEIPLDHVWAATRFQKPNGVNAPSRSLLHEDLELAGEDIGQLNRLVSPAEKSRPGFTKIGRKEKAV